MFSKGDKVIINSSSRRGIINGYMDNPTSLITGRVYFLQGYSNSFFYEYELTFDLVENRMSKISKIKDMLKYGDSNSYQYKLDDEKLRWLTAKTNRSVGQTQFLFNLVDGNFSKLKNLEEKIKNTFSGCPGDLESMNIILDMENKTDRFRLDIL